MSLIRRLGLFMLVAPHASFAANAVVDANHLQCDQIQKKIENKGELNISSVNPYIYERFVSDANYCGRRDRLESAFIATADSSQCFVGYRCIPSDFN